MTCKSRPNDKRIAEAIRVILVAAEYDETLEAAASALIRREADVVR